ncbi:MAG: hypothetical protein ACT4QA_22165 [Panacagrimonas sp.]
MNMYFAPPAKTELRRVAAMPLLVAAILIGCVMTVVLWLGSVVAGEDWME